MTRPALLTLVLTLALLAAGCNSADRPHTGAPAGVGNEADLQDVYLVIKTDQLERYGLTREDVTTRYHAYLERTQGAVTTAGLLALEIGRQADGTPILLSDVAELRQGQAPTAAPQ